MNIETIYPAVYVVYLDCHRNNHQPINSLEIPSFGEIAPFHRFIMNMEIPSLYVETIRYRWKRRVSSHGICNLTVDCWP